MFDAYVVAEGAKGGGERWGIMKPFSASDAAPPPKITGTRTQPDAGQHALTRDAMSLRGFGFHNPFRPPPAPPPPNIELAPSSTSFPPEHVRVAVLIAMPSQHAEEEEDELPYLEFGVLDAEVVDTGKMSSQSEREGEDGGMERRNL